MTTQTGPLLGIIGLGEILMFCSTLTQANSTTLLLTTQGTKTGCDSRKLTPGT